jgi:hypothetical protein
MSETELDELIARILSPLYRLGVRRCDRCYIRVRRAQLGLLITWPVQWLSTVQGVRRRWASIVRSAGAQPATVKQPGTPVGITLPEEVPFGGDFIAPSGLALSVRAMNLQLGTEGTRFAILEVEAHNATDVVREFDNEFGVLDETGKAHRYSGVDSDSYPGALPGFARVDPGDTVRGRAFVHLSGLVSDHPGTLRAAYLAVGDSCGSCGDGVGFVPLALWQAWAIPPDWPGAENKAPHVRDGTG